MSGLAGVPAEKLQYLQRQPHRRHSPRTSRRSYTAATPAANPGFTLEPQGHRQRRRQSRRQPEGPVHPPAAGEPVRHPHFDGKNNYSDVLEAPLTRDRVRAARANLAYDRADPLGGYYFVNVTLSHGLAVLDASTAGQTFLSRDGARPDFTKLEYGLTRFQPLDGSWTVVTGLSRPSSLRRSLFLRAVRLRRPGVRAGLRSVGNPRRQRRSPHRWSCVTPASRRLRQSPSAPTAFTISARCGSRPGASPVRAARPAVASGSDSGFRPIGNLHRR